METLTGPRVRLRPLLTSDAPALVAAAADGELWRLPYTVVPSADTVGDYLAGALAGQAAGTVWPFAIEMPVIWVPSLLTVTARLVRAVAKPGPLTL